MQQFREWEKAQGRAQSYYAFARYLGVGTSSLAAWMEGAALPQGDDLLAVADKLGPGIYAALGAPAPDPLFERLASGFAGLPAGLRERLSEAVVEAAQAVQRAGVAPESLEAKKLIVEIFARRGIRLTN